MSCLELSPLNYRYHALPGDPDEEDQGAVVVRADRHSPVDGSALERRPLNQRQVNYGGINEARPPLVSDKTLSSIFNLTYFNSELRQKTHSLVNWVNRLPQESRFRRLGYALFTAYAYCGPIYPAIRMIGRLHGGLLVLRFLSFIGALIVSAVTNKSKFVVEAGKLLGLTFLRCTFALIIQCLICVFGSLLAFFTLGQWEHSFKLLRLAVEIDNYFDQWECSIDSAYEVDRTIPPDALNADQLFLPFRYSDPDVELERITYHLAQQVNPDDYQAMQQENREMIEAHAAVPNPPVRNLHDMADLIARGQSGREKSEYTYVDGNGNVVPPPPKPSIAHCNARGIIVRGDPVIDLPPPHPYKNPPADDELELVSIS